MDRPEIHVEVASHSLQSGVPTFVLIPGAGGSAWVWSRVNRFLVEAGHEAIAVDLPWRRRDRRAAALHRAGGGGDRVTPRGGARGRVAGRLHGSARLRTGAGARAGVGERDDPVPGGSA